ncbi:hypothetical protein I6F33_21785 [Bradyrhizobium sp. BRP20]|uniref:hypothetical protein n=1 Tax=Bradyrhizobium sp. BRP20 TaxID=2793822 RepID=UPI001CD465E5|nr:hypothetical protein [Bradyrhizobium sp. BRP20]MCA1435598.1 hypothetical protein [Bradyrhizobium sp. BRP20]
MAAVFPSLTPEWPVANRVFFCYLTDVILFQLDPEMLVAQLSEASVFVCRRLIVLVTALLLASCIDDAENKRIEAKSTPQANELQKPLAKAIESDRSGLTKSSEELASLLASHMRDAVAKFKRPRSLFLGNSYPVQLELSTNLGKVERDEWKGFEGELKTVQLRVSQGVSAQLTGPPDMLRITARDEKMKSLRFNETVYWIWDVEPLKPGKATITLEVVSYIQDGKDRAPYPIRVLQDTWDIEGLGIEWVRYQIAQIEPIRAFVYSTTAGLAAVLAWLGITGRKRRRPDFET